MRVCGMFLCCQGHRERWPVSPAPGHCPCEYSAMNTMGVIPMLPPGTKGAVNPPLPSGAARRHVDSRSGAVWYLPMAVPISGVRGLLESPGICGTKKKERAGSLSPGSRRVRAGMRGAAGPGCRIGIKSPQCRCLSPSDVASRLEFHREGDHIVFLESEAFLLTLHIRKGEAETSLAYNPIT